MYGLLVHMLISSHFFHGFVSSKKNTQWNLCVLKASAEKKRFFFYLVALFAFWANLPSASSNFGRTFILNKNDQTYSSKRWLSRLVVWSRLRSSFGMYLFNCFHVWSRHCVPVSFGRPRTRTSLENCILQCATFLKRSLNRLDSLFHALAITMCAITRQAQLRSIHHVCNDKTSTVA